MQEPWNSQPLSMLEATDTTYLDILVFVPKSEQEE
jgi:hypothetical protein